MSKVTLGPGTYLYPMPTALVGANVNGWPNYLTVSYCGVMQRDPPLIAVGLGKSHYTNAGIKENGSFSVNLPSTEMVAATDYCGIQSGRTVDKSRIFETFYGRLGTAPMIGECPISMECRLIRTHDYGGTSEVFVGEVVESYVDQDCLVEGVPDVARLGPILFSPYDKSYWKLGEWLAKAWRVGRGFEPPCR